MRSRVRMVLQRLVSPRRFADDQSGQISFLMVLAMFALTPLVGLIMNVSDAVESKTRAQEVADAAAYASAGAGARSLNFIANGNIAIFELTAWIVVVDALKPALRRAETSLVAQEIASNAMKATPDPTGITLAVATAWNLKVIQEKATVKIFKGVRDSALQATRQVAVSTRKAVSGAQRVVAKGMVPIMNAAGVLGGQAASEGLRQPVVPLPVSLRIPPVLPAIPVQEVTMEHFEGNSQFMGTDVADPGQKSTEELQAEREEEAEKLSQKLIQAEYSKLLAENGFEDDIWDFDTFSTDQIGLVVVDTEREELFVRATETIESMSAAEKDEIARQELDTPSADGTQVAPGGRPSQEFEELYEPVLITLLAATTLSGSGGFLAHEANKRIKDQFRGKASGSNPKTPAPPKVFALEKNEIDQDYADQFFRHTWIVTAQRPLPALRGVFGEGSEPVVALAESLIFNTESWDLVTPRWEAALVPVKKLPTSLPLLPTPLEIHH